MNGNLDLINNKPNELPSKGEAMPSQHYQFNLLSTIKQLVRKKEYSSLETLFLGSVTGAEPDKILPELWQCIEYLHRPQIGLTAYAQTFALFITEHLFEHNYYKEALDHLRRTAYLLNPDRKLRQKIVQAYKIVYINQENLNAFIRFAGLEESTSLSQAITILDKLICLDIGSPVYSSRSGYGEVTKIDFLLDTVAINFSSQIQTITLEQALKSLQPIPKDNLFYLKEKKAGVLTMLIKESPAELEIILKRDLSESTSRYGSLDPRRVVSTGGLKTADIKQALKGAVSDDDIATFIEYLKKTKPKNKKQTSKDTAPADYSSLPALSVDGIIELINSVPSITKQKLVLTLKEKRSDWQEIYLQIFFIQSDKRVLQTIFAQINQETQRPLIDKIFAEYKRYPLHFLYLAETRNEDPYAILTRYLDLARTSTVKFEKSSLAREIRKRLIAQNFELVKKSVVEITSDIAKRILVRFEEIKNLYPEERNAIAEIIKHEFPELFETKSEYIYNTKTAIANKEMELNKILNEEIPQVASEIGRTRSYGDLRENFEFKAALAKQKRLMSKVSEIRQELVKTRPIDFSKIETGKVNIGTTVTLLPIQEKELTTESTENTEKEFSHGLTRINTDFHPVNPVNAQSIKFTILGPWDSDLQKGIISYLAPFAQKLLNKQTGEEIADDEGKIYRIEEITKALENKK